jgi:hypothetical protein
VEIPKSLVAGEQETCRYFRHLWYAGKEEKI